MNYFIIHAITHIALYLFWRYALPAKLIAFFTVNNTLSAKGHIKLAFWLAAIPFTVAAFINMLLDYLPPFELAPFLITLSYLLQVKAFISFMKQQGIVVEDYFKNKGSEE